MDASVHWEICCGTPLDLCRMTNASIPIADNVSMVSRSDSPLFRLELDAIKVMTSADKRFAAVSKLSRVLVESSKNTLAIVRPRKAGTLGTCRAFT